MNVGLVGRGFVGDALYKSFVNKRDDIEKIEYDSDFEITNKKDNANKSVIKSKTVADRLFKIISRYKDY